ncbi:hypothetical protein DSECCO2_587330 [anaerobic digester metagenome]
MTEYAGGIDVAENNDVFRHLRHDLFHIDAVAKMEPGGIGGYQRRNHLARFVAAVMIDHNKMLVGNGLDNFTHIIRRYGLRQVRGKDAGQRFGDDDTVGPRGF